MINLNQSQEIKIFRSTDWTDYEMLDTGGGERLEIFGPYTFVRPFEGAVWAKTLADDIWSKHDGKFWSSKVGAKPGWTLNKGLEAKWSMSYKDIRFWSMPTPFRHMGFFPEQASHWNFIDKKIKKAKEEGRTVKFLNLFGYTGVASLVALKAGAEVTHVDASKQILNLVKENVELSSMQDLPMRVIPEDAVKFLEREIKRGNKYDAVIMDPPKFGRGPKGEIWKIEEDLANLLQKVRAVLSEDALFVILTSYAIEASSVSLGHSLADAMKDMDGQIEQGELCLVEKSKERLVSLANTALWFRD